MKVRLYIYEIPITSANAASGYKFSSNIEHLLMKFFYSVQQKKVEKKIHTLVVA